jgi:hypothetical protein
MEQEAKNPPEEGQAIQKPKSLEEKLRQIHAMRGIAAGGPSMCDELLADRRKERERELAKDGY